MARTPTDPTKPEVWVTKGLDELDFEFYIPQGPKGDPGGFVAATSLSTTNLNDIVVPGLYRQSLSTNATTLLNYPSASSGLLEVFEGQNATDLIQRWTPWGGTPAVGRIMYIRRRDAVGNWSTWITYASSRVDQTAGRAIYEWDSLNNRDQLVWGDTGARRVEADFKNGWTAAIANLRRVGNVVSFGVYTVNPTARTTDIAYSVPAGFKPGPYGGNIAFPVRLGGGTDWTQIAGNGDMYAPTSQISANGYICVTSWITGDAWPTTLPGVASGSIPNI